MYNFKKIIYIFIIFKMISCLMLVPSHVQVSATPWTVAYNTKCHICSI